MSELSGHISKGSGMKTHKVRWGWELGGGSKWEKQEVSVSRKVLGEAKNIAEALSFKR